MDGSNIERISQENECREIGENSLLERASAVARGVLDEIEALAGTTASSSLTRLSIRAI